MTVKSHFIRAFPFYRQALAHCGKQRVLPELMRRTARITVLTPIPSSTLFQVVPLCQLSRVVGQEPVADTGQMRACEVSS